MRMRFDFGVDSSMLNTIVFEHENHNPLGKLTVIFKNNSIYEYDNVSMSDILSVIVAPSYGSAFNKNIRNKYHYVEGVHNA